MPFRCQAVLVNDLSTALDPSEEGLRDTAKKAQGIESSPGFSHKLELDKLVKAWHLGKVQSETKQYMNPVSQV